MSAEDYCDLCDLPKSQCIHGQPPPPPTPARTARQQPASRPRTAPRKAQPPARSAPRRWTPPEAFTATILAVLHDAGGELDADDLFVALEARMQERLTAADRETTPEGELRWRYAARRARQALIADGLMTKGRPGVWALSDRTR
jgi:hypothetical protein